LSFETALLPLIQGKMLCGNLFGSNLINLVETTLAHFPHLTEKCEELERHSHLLTEGGYYGFFIKGQAKR
jgi:hypothetical protein